MWGWSTRLFLQPLLPREAVTLHAETQEKVPWHFRAQAHGFRHGDVDDPRQNCAEKLWAGKKTQPSPAGMTHPDFGVRARQKLLKLCFGVW